MAITGLRRLPIDTFVALLFLTVGLAALFPAHGAAADAKKSLASGLPMALVLFPAHGDGRGNHVATDAVSPDPAGVCAVIASRLSRVDAGRLNCG